MKIAKITLDTYAGHGGVLQNYALEKVLDTYADQVDSIWHEDKELLPTSFRWGYKSVIKYILNWKNFRKQVNNFTFNWEMVRQARIRRFCQNNTNMRYEVGNLANIINEYDYFVVGSDQVWNPLFMQNNCRDEFLTFVPSDKRISYAASIGLSQLPPTRKNVFSEYLRGMASISVREDAGAKIIKELTGLKVPVHVDPTLLLEAKEWSLLEETPAWYDGKPYICTYFLGERPTVVEDIALEYDMPVINILDEKIFDHYITSPEEFLWLIHHASLVYTDSFHGTVFSILFERPFVVCDRVEAGVCNMSSRIDTLLGLFHLEDHYANAKEGNRIPEPFKIDYSNVASIFARERQRSHDYLANAFGIKR